MATEKERLSRPWSNNTGIAFGACGLFAFLGIIAAVAWHIGEHSRWLLGVTVVFGTLSALSLRAVINGSGR